jgi:hypothetical protein
MIAIRRRLALAGALLIFVGMLTGLWAGAALSRMVVVPIPGLALGAHLTAIVGGLWLIAVAWSCELLHYDERGLRRLAWFTVVPAWGNWFATTIASLLGVRGLDFGPPLSNRVIAGMLQILVVIPALYGTALWVYGFRKKV